MRGISPDSPRNRPRNLDRNDATDADGARCLGESPHGIVEMFDEILQERTVERPYSEGEISGVSKHVDCFVRLGRRYMIDVYDSTAIDN